MNIIRNDKYDVAVFGGGTAGFAARCFRKTQTTLSLQAAVFRLNVR